MTAKKTAVRAKKKHTSAAAKAKSLDEAVIDLMTLKASIDLVKSDIDQRVTALYRGYDLSKQSTLTHLVGDYLCTFDVMKGTGNQFSLRLTNCSRKG